MLNIPVPFTARARATGTQSPPDFFVRLLKIDFFKVQKEKLNKNKVKPFYKRFALTIPP